MGSRLSFLFESTSIHGLKHLADADEAWKKGVRRIFWTTFLALSLMFMVRMLRGLLQKQSTSTTINLDTAYRDFDNVFPGVSLCLAKGRSTSEIKDIVGDVFENLSGEKIPIATKHLRAMQGYIFTNYLEPLEGINLQLCEEFNDTCGIDFHAVRDALAPKSCSDIIDKMFYLEKEVNCEEYFVRYETEVGICFVANSLYSKGLKGETNLDNFESLKMRFSNKDNKERSLVVHYKENDFFQFRLFIHTPEELPNGKLAATSLKKIGSLAYIAIKMVEFHNHPDVKRESIDARKCRFPSERFDTFNLPYSLNYCLYLKRVDMELKECNCTLPNTLGHRDIKMCKLSEFSCADGIASRLKISSTEKLMQMIGDCLVPTCPSMEIVRIGEYDDTIGTINKTGTLKIEVLNMPTLRYIRRVSFTRLDMIVQVGGIVGLFFGASFLSVLEIVYLIYRMILLGRAKNHTN